MLIALSRAFLLSKPPGAEFSTRDRHELARLSKQQLVEVWAPAEEIVKACFARRPNYVSITALVLEFWLMISRTISYLLCLRSALQKSFYSAVVLLCTSRFDLCWEVSLEIWEKC